MAATGHQDPPSRDGQRLFERVWRGPSLETPVNVKSASKSVVLALAGIAIGRGLLEGPDQPIAPLLRGERSFARSAEFELAQ